MLDSIANIYLDQSAIDFHFPITTLVIIKTWLIAQIVDSFAKGEVSFLVALPMAWLKGEAMLLAPKWL